MDNTAPAPVDTASKTCGVRAAADTSFGEPSEHAPGRQALGQDDAATMSEAERARQEARAWKRRAEESALSRERIVRRMQSARRDVYDANLRAEEADLRADDADLRAEEARNLAGQAEAAAREAGIRADRSEAAAREAGTRADRAEAAAREAGIRAEQAEAAAREAVLRAAQAQIERDRALRDLDAVLACTAWRATWPLRLAADRLPAGMRHFVRAGARLGWWLVTFKLPRRLHDSQADRSSRSRR